MDTHVPISPSHGMRRLAEFLKETGSRMTPAEAANEAIDDWLNRKRGRLPDTALAPLQGYRWKELFLPEGSLLRMDRADQSHSARVQGNQLVYEGRAMSPHQMTVAIAGKGYNAWRALWVLLPGATRWQQACRLRKNAQLNGLKPTVSPHEALATAAECMSDTLRSALALVDHARLQALPPFERRQERNRRATDVLQDE